MGNGKFYWETLIFVLEKTKNVWLGKYVIATKQATRNHSVFPSSSDVKIKAANCVAIASAVIVRFRSTKASALHYRNSTVLSKLTTK